MKTTIEIINLTKYYQKQKDRPIDTLRDLLSFKFWRKENKKEQHCVFKDLNYSVKEGDVVGIVGRNGAGKSTLLKILSRVIRPSSGKVIVDGKLVSLLELGAGFHPELSGRDNIFLNASIYGQDRKLIEERVEDIISFADIGEYIDSPVKYYSSGMYLRLAFAIIANLDFDIILLDEVFAVGDKDFQLKCKKWFDSIIKSKKTVLIVSHDDTFLKEVSTRTLEII